MIRPTQRTDIGFGVWWVAQVTCDRDTANTSGERGQQEGCGQPAVMVILTQEEVWHAGDVREDLTVANGYCEEHAPEEAHEARASMSPEEFIIIAIPERNAA